MNYIDHALAVMIAVIGMMTYTSHRFVSGLAIGYACCYIGRLLAIYVLEKI